jgi:putative DNA primase/helicase
MRQDYFEFTPQFKLVIAGNHKPGIRSVDEAMRRRFNLIPFTVTIPPDERDPGLAERLREEWPGILAWMLAGCVDWQQRGLAAPEAVLAATAAYLETQDGFSAWLDECCERRAEAWETRTALFESWGKWAQSTGEHVGSRPRFLDALEARGFEPQRTAMGRGFRGLSVKRQWHSDEP